MFVWVVEERESVDKDLGVFVGNLMGSIVGFIIRFALKQIPSHEVWQEQNQNQISILVLVLVL